jgi:hypothetical protein
MLLVKTANKSLQLTRVTGRFLWQSLRHFATKTALQRGQLNSSVRFSLHQNIVDGEFKVFLCRVLFPELSKKYQLIKKNT